MIRVAVVVLAALAPIVAAGQVHERVVYGKVLAVDPVVEHDAIEPTHPVCHEVKPGRREGLSALLTWDLTADCTVRERRTARHYKVRYAWAGREYQHVMDKHPGSTIPLRLEVELDVD